MYQLALDVSHLVSPQGVDARVGLLAVRACGRLIVRVVVVSDVLPDLFELLLRCLFDGLFFSFPVIIKSVKYIQYAWTVGCLNDAAKEAGRDNTIKLVFAITQILAKF